MKEEKEAKANVQRVYVSISQFSMGGKDYIAQYDKLRKRHYYDIKPDMPENMVKFIMRKAVKVS